MQIIETGPPSELQHAIEVYRRDCSSWYANVCQTNTAIEPFAGHPSDLDALSFCEYEGAFPDEDNDLSLACLIWAQVMVVSTEAVWTSTTLDEIAIGITPADYPRVVFYPFVRADELSESSKPQWALFDYLTDCLMVQAILSNFEVKDIPKLTQIVIQKERDQPSAFSLIALALKDLPGSWR